MATTLKPPMQSTHSPGCYFEAFHQSKSCYRPSTPRHGNDTPQRQWSQQENAACETAKKAQEGKRETPRLDPSSKLHRSQSDQASMGCVLTSLIHRGPNAKHLLPVSV